MASQHLQASRLLAVVPSDTIAIPDPSTKVAEGTTTSTGTGSNDVVDTSATFTSTVLKGDIVYDVTGAAIYEVSAVVDDNNLTLTTGSVGNTSSYRIYRGVSKGCKLYVGVTGDVEVITAAGDTEVLTAVPAGSWLPLNVTQVKDTNTTATNITAAW